MKVAIIGLDGVDPDLLFGHLLDEMPNLARLVEEGIHGEIRSSEPPVTVPAWSVFATSKNPGRLGFTGFRNRRFVEDREGKKSGYDDAFIATSEHVDEPALWDVVSQAGKQTVCVGVPQTYPTPEIDGTLVAGMLTPQGADGFTHPPELADEIRERFGRVPLDVPEVEELSTEEVVAAVREGTRKRFALARHLATTRPWDLFFLVEMGTDRLHHALWSHVDPETRDGTPADPRAEAFLSYYRELDGYIGELVEALPDDAAVIVVSDHGAKACRGAVRINEWLAREGYLTLTGDPEPGQPFDPAAVDWSKTRAWGEGGYIGRIHVNVEGREPEGAVDPLDYELLRDELREKLEAMEGPDGRVLGTRVLKPQEIYAGEHVDEAPDLICYFGDLHYRSEATLGHETVVATGSDAVHDEAVHDYQGIFVLHDPEGRFSGEVEGMTLLDGAPTVLELLGVEVPEDMEGRVLRPDGGLHPH